MSRLYYLPDEREVETAEAETILQTSLRAGIPHAHACGGKARCSTCRVLILAGLEHCNPRNAKEKKLAERLHFGPEIRLACQTKLTGNVKLRRPVLDEVDVELTSQIKAGAMPSPVGEEKLIAILFADISGYTSFCEALPPYDVIHVLSRYFHLMGQVISRHDGYISDYVGDGIVALFGVEDSTEAAIRAVKAGIEMLDAVEKLNPYLELMYKKSFQIRIGVHYGEVVVGTIGVANMKKIAAIGDAVNFASRIETANKEMGTKFLISEDTYHQVRDHVRVNRCCIHVTLRGKSGEYVLYEVIGLNGPNDEAI
ncbi:MAG: adenylate/guanylate cyclase domain-containing protein [bacterium]